MKFIPHFLILSLCVACNQGVSYRSGEKKGFHIIDLGSFEVTTPTSYQYSPLDGIDSFVGKISNGKVTLLFDYGCYSPPGPRDRFEVLLRYKDRLDIYNTTEALQFLINLDSVSREGNINVTELQKEIKNVRLLKYVDSISLNIPGITPIEYYHEFEFRDSIYRLPFQFSEEVKANEARFAFERDTIESNIYRKLYYDKKESDTMQVGLYMVDAGMKNESINAYCTKIGLWAKEVSDENLQEIKQIYRSITF